MPDLQTCLQESAAMHDHLCPRQVLGVRAGILAGELLELDLPQKDKRLFAFVETDGCFADGVSAATGCRLGRRTMRLVDYGKVAATFADTYTHRALRISPQQCARARAAHYSPHTAGPWHEQLAAYQVMPTSELLHVEPVLLALSIDDVISRPGLRKVCESCHEEIMNEREVYAEGHSLCRRCAGLESYYELDNSVAELR